MATPRRILIIDDETEFTELAEMALSREAAYEVRILNDSRESLRVVEEFRPEVVVIDIVMPHKDGPEVIREIRAHPEFHAQPIIVMSALLNERALAYKNLNELDVHEVIEKPVRLETLRDRIRAALAG